MNKAIKVSMMYGTAVLKSAMFLEPANAIAFARKYSATGELVPAFTETTALFGVTVSTEHLPADPWGDEDYEEQVIPFTTQEKAEAWARAKAESIEADGTVWQPDPNLPGGTMLVRELEVTRISIGLVEVDQTEV